MALCSKWLYSDFKNITQLKDRFRPVFIVLELIRSVLQVMGSTFINTPEYHIPLILSLIKKEATYFLFLKTVGYDKCARESLPQIVVAVNVGTEARREALMQRAARCSCKRSTVKWWGIVAARGRAIPLNGYALELRLFLNVVLMISDKRLTPSAEACAPNDVHTSTYINSVSVPEEAYSYSPTTVRLVHQMLQRICNETSTAPQVPAYLTIPASLVHLGIFSIFSASLYLWFKPSRILTNHVSLLAVGPARVYSRGKEEKRTKRRNHAESSGSCTEKCEKRKPDTVATVVGAGFAIFP
ncbi:hypothetical protein G5I_10452 [Acromyrmex echinatior]|uniref:Uncharacterized protein n=1 Tax=Acromyrmex echinatior TaxID=103372 RepID=F4WWW3_ACREC|nr:hypothetical protein G5I_10452 [Acromyrmex echinatior]